MARVFFKEMFEFVILREFWLKGQRMTLASCIHNLHGLNKTIQIITIFKPKSSKLSMKSYILAFPIFDIFVFGVIKIKVNP